MTFFLPASVLSGAITVNIAKLTAQDVSRLSSQIMSKISIQTINETFIKFYLDPSKMYDEMLTTGGIEGEVRAILITENPRYIYNLIFVGNKREDIQFLDKVLELTSAGNMLDFEVYPSQDSFDHGQVSAITNGTKNTIYYSPLLMYRITCQQIFNNPTLFTEFKLHGVLETFMSVIEQNITPVYKLREICATTSLIEGIASALIYEAPDSIGNFYTSSNLKFVLPQMNFGSGSVNNYRVPVFLNVPEGFEYTNQQYPRNIKRSGEGFILLELSKETDLAEFMHIFDPDNFALASQSLAEWILRRNTGANPAYNITYQWLITSNIPFSVVRGVMTETSAIVSELLQAT